MGMCVDFLCSTCGLAGHVSGGEDYGMMAGTTTIYCETCDSLQDALICLHPGSDTPHQTPPRCRKRKSHPIRLWSEHQPCPRCGQATLLRSDSGMITIWD